MVLGPFAGGAFAALLAVPMRANSRFIEIPEEPPTTKSKVNAEIEHKQPSYTPVDPNKRKVSLEESHKVDVAVAYHA